MRNIPKTPIKKLIGLIYISVFASIFLCADLYANNRTPLIKILKAEPAVKKVSIWKSKYGDGLLINTQHYEIYTTLLDPLMLRKVPGFLESAHRAYQEIMPNKVDTSLPLKVYLFATREQWEKFSEKFTGVNWPTYKKIQRGAYYLNGSCVAYNIGRRSTFSVLGHEGWHQYASRHFAYRLPSWIDEGLAMHFEAYHKEGGWFKFDARENLSRIGGLKIAIENGQFFSVSQLVDMNPGHVVGSGEGVVSGYYSQVFALVRFFREYNYGVYRVSFEKLLSDGINGDWPLSKESARIVADRNIPQTLRWNAQLSEYIFQKYLGDSRSFQAQYRAYCIGLASKVHIKHRPTKKAK